MAKMRNACQIAAGLLGSTLVRRDHDPLGVNQSSGRAFTVTWSFYDTLDQLASVINANGGNTQYRYDNNC